MNYLEYPMNQGGSSYTGVAQVAAAISYLTGAAPAGGVSGFVIRTGRVSTTPLLYKIWDVLQTHSVRIVANTDYYGALSIKQRMLLTVQHGIDIYGFEMANEPQIAYGSPENWPIGVPRANNVSSESNDYPIAALYKDCEIARRLVDSDAEIRNASKFTQPGGKVPRLMSFAAAAMGHFNWATTFASYNGYTIAPQNLFDIINFHQYPAGQRPNWGGPNVLSESWNVRQRDDVRKAYGMHKPVIQTETGYQNNFAAPSATPVTPEAVGVYILRVFVENLKDNGVNTSLYFQLTDTPMKSEADEKNRGIFGVNMSNGAVVPKPGAFAVRNFWGLLADTAVSHSPQPLAVEITAAAGVSTWLLHNSKGEWLLVCWRRNENAYNSSTKQLIDVAPLNVTLRFSTAEAKKLVTVYRPSLSASPSFTGSWWNVAVPVRADVTVVVIKNGAVAIKAEDLSASTSASSSHHHVRAWYVVLPAVLVAVVCAVVITVVALLVHKRQAQKKEVALSELRVSLNPSSDA